MKIKRCIIKIIMGLKEIGLGALRHFGMGVLFRRRPHLKEVISKHVSPVPEEFVPIFYELSEYVDAAIQQYALTDNEGLKTVSVAKPEDNILCRISKDVIPGERHIEIVMLDNTVTFLPNGYTIRWIKQGKKIRAVGGIIQTKDIEGEQKMVLIPIPPNNDFFEILLEMIQLNEPQLRQWISK